MPDPTDPQELGKQLKIQPGQVRRGKPLGPRPYTQPDTRAKWGNYVPGPALGTRKDRPTYFFDYTMSPERWRKYVGFEPSYFEQPQRVARWYHTLKALPPDTEPPPGINPEEIDFAYQYLKKQNNDAPWWAWKMLNPADPGREFIRNIPAPPEEYRIPGESEALTPAPAPEPIPTSLEMGGITPEQYDALPLWQKAALAVMGSPQLAGGAIGLLAGTPGGLPGMVGGAALGAGLGGLAAKSPKITNAMMFLDYPAEWLERAFGVLALGYGRGIQEAKVKGFISGADAVAEILNNLPAAWQAGHLLYETIPSKSYQLGQLEPTVLSTDQMGIGALYEAFNRIKRGQSPEQVYLEMGNRFGFTGQMRELVGHMFLDPLNVLGAVSGLGIAGAAVLTGNDALRVAMLGSRGLMGGLGDYSRYLRSTKSLDEIADMNRISRWALGLQEITKPQPPSRASKIAGMVTSGGFGAAIGGGIGGPIGAIVGGTVFGQLGWKQGFHYMLHLTPQSRAVEVVDNAEINLAMMLERAGQNVDQMVSFEKSLANTPSDLARDLSMASLNSIDAQLIPMALRDHVGKSETLLTNYHATDWHRAIVENIAQVTGRVDDAARKLNRPANDPMVQDLAKATVLKEMSDVEDGAILLRQYSEVARTAGGDDAAEIVRAIEAGELNTDKISEIVKVFTQDKVPYSADMFRSQMFASMIEHMDDWSSKWFQVKPDPTLIRLSQTIKSGQSLVLLGVNPLFFINNFLNNIVTSAAEGVFGLRTGEQINTIWDRFGVIPPRLRAGWGIASEGDIPLSGIRRAATQPGTLTNLNRFFRDKLGKFAIFSNMSSAVESYSSAQTYTSGMLQAWSRLWRRNVGYKPMQPALEQALGAVHPDLPNLVYGVIQKSMNRSEIETALWSGVTRKTLDTFIIELARDANISEEVLRDTLIPTGIYDYLNTRLGEEMTDEHVGRVMTELRNYVEDGFDEMFKQEIEYTAQKAAAQVETEGIQAVLDIVYDQAYTNLERRYQTLVDWEWFWDDMYRAQRKPTQEISNILFRQQFEETQRSWGRQWKRFEASWTGIAQSLGDESQVSRRLLSNVADLADSWKRAHRRRMDLYSEHFRMEFANDKERMDHWENTKAQVAMVMDDAFQAEQQYQREIGELFAQQIEDYTAKIRGPEIGQQAGQQARDYYNQLVDNLAMIGDETRSFYESLEGLSREQKWVRWRQFNDEKRIPRYINDFTLKTGGIQQVYETINEVEPRAAELPPQPARPPEPGKKAPKAAAPETREPEPTAPPIEEPRPEITPEEAAVRNQVADVMEVGAEYGIPTADENGRPIPGATTHLLRAIKKYAEGDDKLISDEYGSLADVDPDLARRALEARARQPETKPPSPVDDAIVQQEKVKAAVEEWENDVTRAAEGKPDILSPSEYRERLVANLTEVMNLTPEQSEGVASIADARASVWGKKYGRDPAEWYQTRIEGIGTDWGYEAAQNFIRNRRGATTFVEEGRAIIRGFQGADVSTAVHELAHVFRRDLEGPDLKITEDWAGVVDGFWHEKGEEMFARGFERYLADGVAPTPGLAGVFEQFKRWMLKIYNTITGSEIDVDISDEMRGVFDRLLSDDISKPPPKPHLEPVKPPEGPVDAFDVMRQVGVEHVDDKYYAHLSDGEERLVSGKPVRFHGWEMFDFFIHKAIEPGRNRKWTISEGITGMAGAHGETQADVTETFRIALSKVDQSQMVDVIRKSVDSKGTTPRYREYITEEGIRPEQIEELTGPGEAEMMEEIQRPPEEIPAPPVEAAPVAITWENVASPSTKAHLTYIYNEMGLEAAIDQARTNKDFRYIDPEEVRRIVTDYFEPRPGEAAAAAAEPKLVISSRMQDTLQTLGYSIDDIDAMSPREAIDIVNNRIVKEYVEPEVGKLYKQGDEFEYEGRRYYVQEIRQDINGELEIEAGDLTGAYPIGRVFFGNQVKRLEEAGIRFETAAPEVVSPREAVVAPPVEAAPIPEVAPAAAITGPVTIGQQPIGTIANAISKFLGDLGISTRVTEDDFWVTIENDPYIDLQIETHGNRIYFGHYLTENGDTYIDSEMIFEFDNNGMLKLVETAVAGPYREDIRGLDTSFAATFTRNLRNQGFANGRMVDPRTPINAELKEQQLIHHLTALIRDDQLNTTFAKPSDYERYVKELGFNLENDADLNLAYDLMEGAFNLAAREVRADLDTRNAPLAERIKAMAELESKLIRARRTIAKTDLQQFSTPLSISEAAGYAADVRPGDIIGEPTAGTANLIDKFYGRTDVTVRTNEIDPGRRLVMENIGYKPTGIDVISGDWVLSPDGKFLEPWANVMIINPPWGSYGKGIYGKPIDIPVKLNDWSQRFTYLIQQRLAKNGRVAAVVPLNWVYTRDRKTGGISVNRSKFIQWIENNHTLKAIIEAPPGAYKERATDIGSLLVVFDEGKLYSGTPDGFREYNLRPIERWGVDAPKDWDEYAWFVEQLGENGAHARSENRVRISQEGVKYEQPTTPEQPTTGPDATGLTDPAAIRGESRGDPTQIGRPDVGDVQRAAEPGGAPGVEPAIAPERGAGPGEAREPVVPERQERLVSPQVVDAERRRVPEPAKGRSISSDRQARIDTSRQAIANSGVFTEAVGRSPFHPDEYVNHHPALVVETKSLAGVPYPPLEPAYRPSEGVLRAMSNNALSLEGNVDPIWAAIQQNDKNKSGILIADDVGIGKSRTAAGYVIDRIEKGRKKILVMTINPQNVDNLMNTEFPGAWAGAVDENGAYTHIPSEFPARRIAITGQSFPKVKKGEELLPTFDEPTVYFISASEFKNFGDALKNIDFDVVVVDEVHAFKNVNGTQRGGVWYDLHKQWLNRDTDFLYLSATPGMDIDELRYLYGLKIWTQDGFDDWIKVITGQISPEKMKERQASEMNIEKWLATLDEAKANIQTKPATRDLGYYNGGEVKGVEVAPGLFVYYNNQGWYGKNKYHIYWDKDGSSLGYYDTETEAVLISSLAAESTDFLTVEEKWLAASKIRDAQSEFSTRYPQPTKSDLRNVEIRDASDIISKSEKGKWGAKGKSPFETTITPAHTEQIMRELKLGGHYVSRDIARTGVDFSVKEIRPTPQQLAQFDRRVGIYRKIYDAWNRFGKFNEGPKKAAALYGVIGDLQADAKRAQFNMRLPGIMREADEALARGEKVVISVVSVGESTGESGFLRNAIGKINTQEVKKIGDGEYSDATELPEALIEIATIREEMMDLEDMPAPQDTFSAKWGDRFGYITGAVDAKDRAKIAKEFQDEKIDVIMISGAGKTGINLHDITGNKRVHLIVGDFEWSPTQFKQELGRVDRTGQKSSPIVSVLHNGSAAERKFVSTIANRMQGLGATSKGGAESTGTTALTEEFELGTTLDRIALNDFWQELDVNDKLLFMDKYFKDRSVADQDVPRSTLDTTAEAMKKYLLALQTMRAEDADRIWNTYMLKRDILIDSDAAKLDEARKTAQNSGQIVRTTDLSDNLKLTEVVNTDGHKYAVLEGVLTPHMNKIRNLLAGYYETGNAWMRWVRFHDPEKNTNVSGMKIVPGKIKGIAEQFGKKLGGMSTPESILTDLHAGDRVKIHGEDLAEWSLYIGQGGAREGRIVVEGARMKSKDALLGNGALYNAQGNFFFVPQDNVQRFIKRFPIRSEETGPLYQTRWFPTEKGYKRTLFQERDGAVVQDADGTVSKSKLEGETPPPVNMPLGTIDSQDTTPPISLMSEDVWKSQTWPLLKQLQNRMTGRAAREPTNMRLGDLPPNVNRELQAYLGQVFGNMADTKLASIRWAENRRDAALLNYSRRYGFDNIIGAIFPYQFWYTRSALNWFLRSIDKPAWLANWARIHEMQDKVTAMPGFPSRLRGKMRMPVPFMPKWAGEAVYIDPWHQIFPFEQLLRPYKEITDKRNLIARQAGYTLERWVSEEKVTLQEAQQAYQTQSGALWEKALAEANLEAESEAVNPYSFVSLLTQPSLPLTVAGNFLKGTPEKIQQLPVTRLVQAATAWAVPGGVNIEGPLRKMAGMPERGELGEFYIMRELANMVADGTIDNVNEALTAGIEKQGPAYEMALDRVGKYQAARFAGAALWLDFFPEGEEKQRILQQQFSQAIDSNDPDLLSKFFEDNPEYRARLQMGNWDDPEQMLRNFLISQVWENYRAAPDLHRKQLTQAFGDVFEQAFLDKETRSYDAIDTPTLAMWARKLGGEVTAMAPETPDIPVELADEATTAAYQDYRDFPETQWPGIQSKLSLFYNLPQELQDQYRQMYPQIDEYNLWRNQYMADNPNIIPYAISEDNKVAGEKPEIQKMYYQYLAQRDRQFPGVLELQDQYYDNNKPKGFLKQNPMLTDYWDWRRSFLAQAPEMIPYIVSTETLAKSYLGKEYQAPPQNISFKMYTNELNLTDKELAQYSPALIRQLMAYFFSGDALGSGASKELKRLWEKSGRGGNFEDYLQGPVRTSLAR